MRHIETAGVGDVLGTNAHRAFQQGSSDRPALPRRITSIDRSFPMPQHPPIISPTRIVRDPGLPVRGLPEPTPRNVQEIPLVQINTGNNDSDREVPQVPNPVRVEPPRPWLPQREDLIFTEGDHGAEFIEVEGYTLLTPEEVQERLQVSDDELYIMAAQNRLLTVVDRGAITFPDIQFSEDGTVLPGIARVVQDIEKYGRERGLEPLHCDVAEAFITRVNALDGKTIIQAIIEDPESETLGDVVKETLTAIEKQNARSFLYTSGLDPLDDRVASMTNISDVPLLDLAVLALHGRLGLDTIGLDTGVGDALVMQNSRSMDRRDIQSSFTSLSYGLMTEEMVMDALGVDKEVLEARIRRHEMLAYNTKEGWVFPDTQFIPDGEEGNLRVVPGLSHMLLNLLETPDSTTERPHLKHPRWAVGQALHTAPFDSISPYRRSIMGVLHAECDAEFIVTFPDNVHANLENTVRIAQKQFPVVPLDSLHTDITLEEEIHMGIYRLPREVVARDSLPVNPLHQALSHVQAIRSELQSQGREPDWRQISDLLADVHSLLDGEDMPTDNVRAFINGRLARLVDANPVAVGSSDHFLVMSERSLPEDRSEQLALLGWEFRSRIVFQIEFPLENSTARGDEVSPVATQTYRDGTNNDVITYIACKPERVGDTEWGNFDFTPSHAVRIEEQHDVSDVPEWSTIFAIRGDGVIVRDSSYNGTSEEIFPHVSRELDAVESVALLNYMTAPHVYGAELPTALRLNNVDIDQLRNVWGLSGDQVDQIDTQHR